MRASRFLTILSCAVALAIVSAVWFPVHYHYQVSNTEFTPKLIEEARNSPRDALLDELNGLNFFAPGWVDQKQLEDTAEKMLRGEIDMAGYPAAHIAMPFRAEDLEKDPPELQLTLASLAVPDILLDAYQRTGREEFLSAARDVIVAWAKYERQAWLPKGFLWNDHAIAARTLVLAKFWRFYRHHSGYQPQVAALVLDFVTRNAAFLAKPSHYTFATNHGVMQNLALLHLSLAFPSLPDVKQYQDLAIVRLRQEFAFYVDDEGLVLEHSAEYHETGLHFLAMACRYLTLLKEPVPPEWAQKYQKARSFFSAMRRPDGSLPVVGDTSEGPNLRGPEISDPDASGQFGPLHYDPQWRPTQPYNLFPVSGYAAWWDGLEGWPHPESLRQTVTAWSYSPGSAHKHSDEMSVLLWAAGQTWWTNTGYWPYGREGRAIAESWPGSNAPHLVDEPKNSLQETRLTSAGVSEHVNVIHLERKGPQNYRASRQVIYWKPNLWIVLDHATGSAAEKTTHTWTTAADVEMRPGTMDGSYHLQSNHSQVKMTAFLLSSPGTQVKMMKGSMSPFAGWQVVEHVPEPSSSLVVEQSAQDSWAVTIWALEAANSSSETFSTAPSMIHWKNDTNWELRLPLTNGQVSMSRQDQQITLHHSGGNPAAEVLTIFAPPDPSAARAEIQAKFEEAAGEYPRFRDLIKYREKVSYVLVLCFLLQETAFLFGRRRANYTRYAALRIAAVLLWIGAGFWIVTVFLS